MIAFEGAREPAREGGIVLSVEDLPNLGFCSSSLLSTTIVFREAGRNGTDWLSLSISIRDELVVRCGFSCF